MPRTLAASRVLATHRQLASARVLNGAFTPLTDPNLQGLWSASGPFWQNTPRTTPAALQSDPVFVWDDLSPFARHWVAISSGRRPLLQLNQQNALPGLLFDGSQTAMATAAAADFKFTGDGSPWAFFGLFKTTTTEPNKSQTLLDNLNGSSANRGIQLQLVDAAASAFGDNYGLSICKGGATVLFAGSTVFTNGSFQSGAYHLLELIFSPTNGLDTYVDGWFIGNTPIAVAPNDGTPALTMSLGLNTSNLTQPFGGTVIEMAFTRGAVNTQRRKQWEQYFRTRFATQDLATFQVTRRDVLRTGNDVVLRNYAAFPSLVKAADGELITWFTDGVGHFNNDQRIVQRKTTGGRASWGTPASETVWFDTANRADDCVAVQKLASGRLLGVWSVENAEDTVTPPSRVSYTRYSDDNGATWSAQSAAVPAGVYDNWLTNGGKVLELTPGGDILMPCYARKQSQLTTYDILILRSQDGGATWAPLSTISDVPHGWQFEEPQLGLLDDGRIMLLVRVDGDHSIRRCWSSDGGATWTALNWVFPGYGYPEWLQLSTGTIICMTRHRDPSHAPDITLPYDYVCYRLSRTRGETWEAEVQLVPHFYLYHSLVDLGGGKAGIVYCYGMDGGSTQTVVEYIEVVPTA